MLSDLTDVDLTGLADGQTLVYDAVSGTWLPGTITSGSSAPALRHDWVGPYSYCGTAPAGSLDAAEVWTINRVELSAAGAVVATLTATGVAWDDRLTATYA